MVVAPRPGRCCVRPGNPSLVGASMKKILRLATFALVLLAIAPRAQSYTGSLYLLLLPPDLKRMLPAPGAERVEANRSVTGVTTGAMFAISTFNKKIVSEFSKAWQRTSCGASHTEAVVLILRMVDGSFSARSQGFTNEFKRFTFAWHPATVAIVHTHPNGSDPRPQADDCALADKYKVPVFTITNKGMYVYDPFTRKTSLVQEDLDWLEPSKWETNVALK